MELARNDGCAFHFWATPVEVTGDGKVQGLKVKTPDGERVIGADLIIKAIGQEKQSGTLRNFGIAVDDKGRAVIDAARKTSRAKVWAGGDCVNGGKEIVNASEDGKQAARAIHASFG
jgi:glutamate synthase (NADPH/NADH) small chain